MGAPGQDEGRRGGPGEGLESIGAHDDLMTGHPVGDDPADEQEPDHRDQLGCGDVPDVAGIASDLQDREGDGHGGDGEPAVEMTLHVISKRKLRLLSGPLILTRRTPIVSFCTLLRNVESIRNLVVMTSEIPVTQARDELADLINRVSYGHERIVLTRHSKPVACIVPPADLARLEHVRAGAGKPRFTGLPAAAASRPPLIGGPMPVAAQHQRPGQPRG